jgi:hypothetical protein
MTVRQLRLIVLALCGAVAGAVGHRIITRRRADAAGSADAHESLTCACGAQYRVVGTGRHRVYWPADADERGALMSSECPECGRSLDA